MTKFLDLSANVKSMANRVGALGLQIKANLFRPGASAEMIAKADADLDAIIETATKLRAELRGPTGASAR